MNDFQNRLKKLLSIIYSGDAYKKALRLTSELHNEWKNRDGTNFRELSEKDVILITYGDGIYRRGEAPLRTLNRFLRERCRDGITNVHLLPIFPYTSDDGFSISDYKAVNPSIGDWSDVSELGKNFGLMLDAVINHTSKSHEWFLRCLIGEEPYTGYYIEADPDEDYSMVTRPRALPLLNRYTTSSGEKWYWTTFSEDQIDLNYKSPRLLCEILDVLLTYARNGARFIRLDAIGFAWKKSNTSCMHLPETHAIVKLIRLFLEELFPGVLVITETNVPHLENISYFGDGDEAHMVYQFPLPPLVMYTLLSGSSTRLSEWLEGLERTPLIEGTTFINFLASHDGIGVRPVDGILNDAEKQLLYDSVLKNGGRISYKQNPDGTQSPYELNISYMDAITGPDASDEERVKRFIASQAIMLSIKGVPGIYYHSLLGSRNWYEGVKNSRINRKINREKLEIEKLSEQLDQGGSLRNRVFDEYMRLLKVRSSNSAFSPFADQEVLDYGPEIFALKRVNSISGDAVTVLINVTGKTIPLKQPVQGTDMLEGKNGVTKEMAPYQISWINVRQVI